MCPVNVYTYATAIEPATTALSSRRATGYALPRRMASMNPVEEKAKKTAANSVRRDSTGTDRRNRQAPADARFI